MTSHCEWCNAPIHGESVACPIRYNPNRVYAHYKSSAQNVANTSILSDVVAKQGAVSIVQLVDNATFSMLTPKSGSIGIRLEKVMTFETRGKFCGFECALGFADHTKDPMYAYSSVYLRQLQYKINKNL